MERMAEGQIQAYPRARGILFAHLAPTLRLGNQNRGERFLGSAQFQALPMLPPHKSGMAVQLTFPFLGGVVN